jgi:hypothetical protein
MDSAEWSENNFRFAELDIQVQRSRIEVALLGLANPSFRVFRPIERS